MMLLLRKRLEASPNPSTCRAPKNWPEGRSGIVCIKGTRQSYLDFEALPGSAIWRHIRVISMSHFPLFPFVQGLRLISTVPVIVSEFVPCGCRFCPYMAPTNSGSSSRDDLQNLAPIMFGGNDGRLLLFFLYL